MLEKGDEQKKWARFIKICNYTCFNVKKRIRKKLGQVFLRFVSILFNLIIFSVKRSYRNVWGLYVCFF